MLPHHADYHRTVVGYHGTRASVAQSVVGGHQDLEPSRNDDDWLGHGVYYWQYAPQQAFAWAMQESRRDGWDEDIAVVGSMIRLGNCFDLLDPENINALDRYHQLYLAAKVRLGERIAKNVRGKKRLNCEIFEMAYAGLAEPDFNRTVDSCRAVFVPTNTSEEGRRLWAGAGIYRRAHVQICVRNTDCILGTWLVKPIGAP